MAIGDLYSLNAQSALQGALGGILGNYNVSTTNNTAGLEYEWPNPWAGGQQIYIQREQEPPRIAKPKGPETAVEWLDRRIAEVRLPLAA